MKKKHASKRVPHFWWDMEGNNIIVESDCDKYPIVAKYPFEHYADAAIELAEKCIADLNAGRATPCTVR